MSSGIGDLIMGMTFFYSVADLGLQWRRYTTCVRPLNVWILGSYAAIAAFRVCQHLICRHLTTFDDDEFLFALTSDTSLPIKTFQYGFVYPFLVGWTVTGTLWLRDIIQQSPSCLPDDNQPWFILLWISFCYVFILIQTFFLLLSMLLRWKVMRLQQSLQTLESADVRHRWGGDHITMFPGLGRTGLGPNEILKLPTEQFTQSTQPFEDLCSICLDDYQIGDKIRIMPGCNHRFHQGCADLWLLRRAMCPNCKMNLKGGASEATTRESSLLLRSLSLFELENPTPIGLDDGSMFEGSSGI